MDQRGRHTLFDILRLNPGDFHMSKFRATMSVLAIIIVLSIISAAQSPAPKGSAAPAAGLDPALIAKANEGNADAEFRIGVQYELGARVKKDPKQAAEWYLKAAEKGDVRAQHSLGVLYEFGNGVPADHAAAVQWYRKAAEKGFAPAQFSLGLCYVHGTGVPLDYRQAVAWYESAAQQRNSDALLNLAYLYHNGLGVPKNEAQSFDYVRQAAEAGSADAQFQMGMEYQDGEHGVQPDKDLARKWLRRSAEQGDVAAQFNYAMMLKAQPSEVYFWLGLATPHLTGSTKQTSQQLRDKAAALLNPTQRTAIDRRVKDWHPVAEQQ
jgi:TPR repeat protein